MKRKTSNAVALFWSGKGKTTYRPNIVKYRILDIYDRFGIRSHNT